MPRPLAFDAVGDGLAVAVTAALVVLVVWPVTTVLVAAPGGAATMPAPEVVLTTLAVAAAATAAALAGGAVLAWALCRVDVRGRELAWGVLRLGVLVPPFVVPLALLVLGGPAGLLGPGGSVPGVAAIVVGQALAFLPHATVLLVRALAGVPIDLEQAAEGLGARRPTVLRRVTLGLAGPPACRAALLVLGLCLADVATPLLLGGDAIVLATLVLTAASGNADRALGAALALTALAATAAVVGTTWRHVLPGAGGGRPLPRLERPAPAATRWSLGAAVWLGALGLATLWTLVPLASLLRPHAGDWGPSLAHWAVVTSPAAIRALENSLALGVGAAVAGTALALATGRVVERGRRPWRRAVEWLARVPVGVPGVVAGVGYLLAFGAAPPPVGALPLLVAVVACWQLPVGLHPARAGLVRSSPSTEEAAVSLGAARAATLWRIVVPALRPVAAGILGVSFAAGVLAVGPVIVLAAAGTPLGATALLDAAAAGEPGAACALATVLLAVAGGALVLGRAVAGPDSDPTLLA